MFERSSCIQGSANQGDNLNQIGNTLKNFEWENGFDRAESSSLETVSLNVGLSSIVLFV